MKEAHELTKENYQLTKANVEKEIQLAEYYPQLYELEERIRADTLKHDAAERSLKSEINSLRALVNMYKGQLREFKVPDPTRGETQVQHDSVDENEDVEGDRSSEFSSYG